MPCKHLSEHREKQLNRIKDVSCFDDAAQQFINLIPACCSAQLNQPLVPINSHFNFDSLDSISSNIGTGIANEQISSSAQNGQRGLSEQAGFLNNYVNYLNDANIAIYKATKASNVWSRPYDASTNVVISSPTSSEQNYTDSGIYMNNHATSANDVNNFQVPSNSSSPIELTPNLRESNNHEQLYATQDNPIGPFLSKLMQRLDAMTEHDVYSNLQLTGLISRLAAFPQPLLRSFFLNNMLSLNRNVPNMWNILATLQQKIDTLSKETPDFDEILYRARRFFAAREERLLSTSSPVRYFNEQMTSPNPSNTRRSSNVSNTSAEVVFSIDYPKGMLKILNNKTNLLIKDITGDKRRLSLKQMFGFRTRTSSSSQSLDGKQLKPVLESVNTGYR